MKKFIEQATGVFWFVLLLLTLLILMGEPPIGADPDMDRYHAESRMMVHGWVVVLCIATTFTFLKYLGKKE